jgi:hypothetical protein
MPEPIKPRDKDAITQFYGDDPTGPGAAQVMQTQSPTSQMGEVAVEILGELAEHRLFGAGHERIVQYAEQVGSHSLKLAGDGILAALSAVTGTVAAFEYAVNKPMDQGEALVRGYASDQARFAGALIAQVTDATLLPSGYVESLKGGVVGSGSFFNSPANKMATQVLARAAGGDAAAIAFRDHLISSIRSGSDAAHLNHLDSQAKLDQLLKSDTAFNSRYHADPGFQIGLRAAVWQAQIFPDDFVRAESSRALQTATIQLSRGA